MKHLKTFESFLNERFSYGKSLFADSSLAIGSQDSYRLFIKRVTGRDEEPNTPDEKELYTKLWKYITTNDRMAGKEGLSADDLKPLIPLKKKFPGILDPEYQGKIYKVYRGMSMDIDELVSIIEKNKPEYNTQMHTWKISVSTPIQSRRTSGFTSFSINERSARNFALDNARTNRGNIKNGRWPIVAGVSYKSIQNDCLFNPRFIDQIHQFGEEEIIYLGTSFKTDTIEIADPIYVYNENSLESLLFRLRDTAEGKTIKKLMDAIKSK